MFSDFVREGVQGIPYGGSNMSSCYYYPEVEVITDAIQYIGESNLKI